MIDKKDIPKKYYRFNSAPKKENPTIPMNIDEILREYHESYYKKCEHRLYKTCPACYAERNEKIADYVPELIEYIKKLEKRMNRIRKTIEWMKKFNDEEENQAWTQVAKKLGSCLPAFSIKRQTRVKETSKKLEDVIKK